MVPSSVRRPESVINEADSIQKALASDPEAYGDLVERHQAQVFRLCLAILADRHEAQDAAQNAFIKGFRALARFQGQSSFSTWLTRIAINECKDRLRSRRRRAAESLDALLDKGGPLPASLIQPMTEGGGVDLSALEALSPGERELLDLASGDAEPSYADMGSLLGLSVDAVKGRLKRVRTKVRRLLGAKEET